MSEESVTVCEAARLVAVSDQVPACSVDWDALSDDEVRDMPLPEDLGDRVVDAIAALDRAATEARRLGHPDAAELARERDDLVAEVYALGAAAAARAPSTWGVGDTVLVADKWSPGGSAPALVMADDPDRPTVVKVKYLHSKTAAWVARDRVLGPAPAPEREEGAVAVDAVVPPTAVREGGRGSRSGLGAATNGPVPDLHVDAVELNRMDGGMVQLDLYGLMAGDDPHGD
jgi:hypothetical protein